jgi:hypothetical protein
MSKGLQPQFSVVGGIEKWPTTLNACNGDYVN